MCRRTPVIRSAPLPCLLAAAVLGLCGPRSAVAEKFPYEATIAVDQAEVRSGPGEQYYATARLPRGTRVTVVRHDDGGWRTIEPPAGSFSYIRPEHVRQFAGGRGVVYLPPSSDGRASRAVVRIGSQLSAAAAYSGRYLRNGDSVTVLGSAVVEVGGEQREMLKVLPPAREYRYIRGDLLQSDVAGGLVATEVPKMIETVTTTPSESLQAFGTATEETVSGDPLQMQNLVPPPQTPTADTSALDSEVSRGLAGGQVRVDGATPAQAKAEREHLSALDQSFRDMVAADPATWDLATLQTEYETLRQTTQSEAMRRLVDRRLAMLAKRRDVYQKYQDFLQLTTRTSQRERELLSQQEEIDRQREAVESTSPEFVETSPNEAQPLVGAGIVVAHVGVDGVTYRLVDPDRRPLAILRPAAGVDLTAHVNYQRGVTGVRVPGDNGVLDVITVTGLRPVTLSPADPNAASRRP